VPRLGSHQRRVALDIRNRSFSLRSKKPNRKLPTTAILSSKRTLLKPFHEGSFVWFDDDVQKRCDPIPEVVLLHNADRGELLDLARIPYLGNWGFSHVRFFSARLPPPIAFARRCVGIPRFRIARVGPAKGLVFDFRAASVMLRPGDFWYA